MFTFKERKQNWLGVSKEGNSGSALGMNFAEELANNIANICNTNNLSKSIHIEKMFLLNRGVGKDKISDMVTNILFDYFVEYTQTFAKQYLSPERCKTFMIPKCKFDYEKSIFVDKSAYLPFITIKNKTDFVILTPASILRKDEQEINF